MSRRQQKAAPSFRALGVMMGEIPVQCAHTNLAPNLKHVTLKDSNIAIIELTARCNTCGAQMMGIGISEGKSPFRAASPDGGVTVCIPIVAVGERPDIQPVEEPAAPQLDS